MENNNQNGLRVRGPFVMSLSLLIIGAAVVIAVIAIACLLIFVGRSGRD
jgi:hypothetical protein